MMIIITAGLVTSCVHTPASRDKLGLCPCLTNLQQQQAVHHSIFALGQAILILWVIPSGCRHAGCARLLGPTGSLALHTVWLLAGGLLLSTWTSLQHVRAAISFCSGVWLICILYLAANALRGSKAWCSGHAHESLTPRCSQQTMVSVSVINCHMRMSLL